MRGEVPCDRCDAEDTHVRSTLKRDRLAEVALYLIGPLRSGKTTPHT
jgi:hypothetical protein